MSTHTTAAAEDARPEEAPTRVMPMHDLDLPFEAKVLREAALASRMARDNNCTIEIHIGGRMGKQPVDIRIHPQQPMSVAMADGKMERIKMGVEDGSELHD